MVMILHNAVGSGMILHNAVDWIRDIQAPATWGHGGGGASIPT